MDREQIRQILEYLAKHRDEFYRSYLDNIEASEPEVQEKIWTSLERRKFEDRDELIIYFEGDARL